MAEPQRDRGRPADLEGDLGWMLGVVFRAYVKAADHALRDLPGGPRGYQVLTAAAGTPPRNQGAIAEDLGIDRTVLTYLIDDLERLDLVARHPDPADRRSRLVVATDRGRDLWRQLRDQLRRVEAHVLSPLPAADAATFQALLSRLACRAQTLDPLADMCEAARRVKADEAPPRVTTG
ncbi:MAG: winged helix-turn-helix transcriptional regulator [Actinobacteria bacterium]|nr:winged helix-turn-helix transcriptional regulator [Actinomycetota bacterium]